tara:strand:- start:158 stop:1747 length:1590 start_codon:yes stop_codon:yes gene_type:complete
MGVVYLIVAAVLFLKIIIQLFSLARIIKKNPQAKVDGFTQVKAAEQMSPFSFFNYIVYNPTMYTANALKTVIAHEQVHAAQKHSADILLMHLLCAIQWFNPIVWRYKKVVAQNLEYIADAEVTSAMACKKEYQYLLLHQSEASEQQLTIINPFFNSLIKKRIVMINRKKSNPINTLKFSIALPFLALFMLTWNTTTVAQTLKVVNKSQDKSEAGITKMTIDLTITNKSTEAQIQKDVRFVKDEYGIDLKFFGIQRDAQGEITAISSSFKHPDGFSGNYNVSGDKPISPLYFSFEIDQDNKILSIGYGTVEKVSGVHKDQGTISIQLDEDGELSEETKTKISTVVQTHIDTAPVIAVETGRHNLSAADTQVHTVSSIKNDRWNPENPIIYVDGKEMPEGFDVNTLDPDQIATLNVFKGQMAYDKYGKKATNGIIEITMKENGSKKHAGNASAVNENTTFDLSGFYTDPSVKPLIIIDGVDKGRDYKKVVVKNSELIGVRFASKNKATTKEYGKKGKDGVIEITTKKGKRD